MRLAPVNTHPPVPGMILVFGAGNLNRLSLRGKTLRSGRIPVNTPMNYFNHKS